MADSGKFEIQRIGGMNDGMHPSAIQDTEFAEIYNWIVFAGKAIRRGGIKNSVSETGPQNAVFNSLYLYSYATNKGVVIIGADSGLFKLEPGSDAHLTDVVQLQSTDNFSAGTAGYPWHFAKVNGIGYAVRRGAGMRRFERDYHSPAGISPPTWAPVLTVTDPNRDDIPPISPFAIGDYYGVVTYRNSRTGAESNPGPASLVATAEFNSFGIVWSELQPSNDAQVDTIRLWITLVDQTDSYFLVGEAAVTETSHRVGDTQHFADLSASIVDSLGGLVSEDNGLPPDGARSLTLWDDTLVLHDGTDVYVSEILLPESFSDQILNVYRDDGAEIRGVLAWGSKLVVGKTNKVHYFTKTAPRTYQRKTLDERNGVASQGSMQVIGSELFWFSGNSKNICRSSGYGSEQVVNTELKEILDRYTAGDPDTGVDELINAVVWPEKNLYMLSLPLDGALHNTHTICYNYKDNTFSMFDYASGHAPLYVTTPTILDPLGDDQMSGDMLAVFGDNRVYRFINRDQGYGQDDYGGSTYAISARLLTKMFSQKGQLLANRFVWILADLDTEIRGADFEMSLYIDGQSTAYNCALMSFKTADETSDAINDSEPDRAGVSNPWKRYNMDNIRQAAALLQIGIVYEGTPAVEISEMALDSTVFERTHKVAVGVPCVVPAPTPEPESPADPLTISNISATIPDEGQTFSTITWDTNRAADSTIEWGLTVAYGDTVNDPAEVTSHSLDTNTVVGETTYHYRVTSFESATGYTTVSADQTFTSGTI